MAVEKQDKEKEVSEEKDLRNRGVASKGAVKDTVKKFVKDLSEAPAPKQVAVGAACGWLVGYLTMKVGKLAATAVGGSLLVLQIAHHKGYVHINWNQLKEDGAAAAEELKNNISRNSRTGVEKFQEFAANNVYVAGGFTGGFFLGIAYS